MRHQPTLHWIATMAAVLSMSCAGQPGAKMASDLRTLEVERSPDKLVARGRAYAAEGDTTRAEQYLAAAMAAGAPASEVLPLLLRVCITGNRHRAAIGYAEPELQKHPADRRLRLVLGALYAAIGEHAAARRQFEVIVRDAPDSADAHYALAVLLRDSEGDLAGADVHFREYLRLQPDGPHAEEARASTLKVVP